MAKGNGRDKRGRFTAGNQFSTGNPLGGKVEQFRALVLQTSQKQFPEVVEKLFELAREGQQWAVQEVLNRVLGKVGDAQPLALNENAEQTRPLGDKIATTVTDEPHPPKTRFSPPQARFTHERGANSR